MVTALGPRLSPGIADDLDLFCADGVLETPCVAPGHPSRWEGQGAIAAYPAQGAATVVPEYDGTAHLEQAATSFQHATKGGHFAAWEQAGIFAREVTTAFRPVR